MPIRLHESPKPRVENVTILRNNPDGFDAKVWIETCIELIDLTAFRQAMAGIPLEMRADIYEQLRRALSSERVGEPTSHQMRSGTELIERQRTPAALFLKQVRLEKLAILAEAVSTNTPTT